MAVTSSTNRGASVPRGESLHCLSYNGEHNNLLHQIMKKLTTSLLESRKDELKRRKFLQNAPVVVAFLLAAGATPVHATEEIPVVNEDQIDPV